jgi:hypothetical protein
MKKTILSLSIMALSALSAFAGNATLVLWHFNGSQTKVELSVKPNLKISADSLTISSPTVTLRYASTDVYRFSYENVSTGVKTVQMGKLNPRMDGGYLYFSGIKANAPVRLFSTQGKELPVTLTPCDCGMRLSLNTLPAGVYLLTIDGKTCKIMKR